VQVYRESARLRPFLIFELRVKPVLSEWFTRLGLMKPWRRVRRRFRSSSWNGWLGRRFPGAR
jgi:hypothetical protein